jgi:hypothetical protein
MNVVMFIREHKLEAMRNLPLCIYPDRNNDMFSLDKIIGEDTW